MNKIKTIIVDDHKIYLDGLYNMLNENEQIEIIKTFNKSTQVLPFIKQNAIDLLITDIAMPEMNGLELIEKVKEYNDEIKILVITMFDEQIKHNYVDGYMLKDSEFSEVLQAIENITIKNEKYISHRIKENTLYDQLDESFSLSKREKDIISLISLEFTTEQIANELHISKHTVETHRKNIFTKLKVKNIAGLVKKSFYLGIVK